MSPPFLSPLPPLSLHPPRIFRPTRAVSRKYIETRSDTKPCIQVHACRRWWNRFLIDPGNGLRLLKSNDCRGSRPSITSLSADRLTHIASGDDSIVAEGAHAKPQHFEKAYYLRVNRSEDGGGGEIPLVFTFIHLLRKNVYMTI